MSKTITVKFFDKPTLLAAIAVGNHRNYNRQLDLDAVNDEFEDKRFPVVFSMLHEHANGTKVDPHVRAMVCYNSEGDTVLLDVDMGIYNSLPTETVKVPADVA
jgi:hypothetical protein